MSTKTSEYRKRTVFLLFGLLLVRFWLGQTFALTPDEAYSWAKGRVLDWAYWDQGVLTPLLTRLGPLFFGPTELGLRWLAANIFIGTGFVLFYTARLWFGARAAFWTVLGYAVLPAFSVPLLLLTDTTVSVGLVSLALLTYTFMLKRPRAWIWLLGGLISALGVMTSLWNLWWIAGLLFLTRAPWRQKIEGGEQGEFAFPGHLKSSTFQPWFRYLFLGGVIIGFIPWLVWQQRPEVADLHLFQPLHFFGFYGHFQPHGFLHFFANQAIALSPAFLLLLILFFRQGRFMGRHEPRWGFFAWLGGPGLLALLISSLWTTNSPPPIAVFYLPLLPLGVATVLRGWDDLPARRGLIVTLSLLTIAHGLLALIPLTSPYVLPGGAYAQSHLRELAEEVARAEQDRGATFVLAEDPRLASALSFYLPNQPFVYVVRGEGVRSQFDFWAGYEDYSGASAVLVTSTSAGDQVHREFAQVEPWADPLPPRLETAGWKFFFCEYFGSPSEPLIEESLQTKPEPKKR